VVVTAPLAAPTEEDAPASPALLFVGGEVSACFSYTETRSNSLGIEENYKPITYKECGLITSVTPADKGKFFVSVETEKKKFNKIPLCVLENTTSKRQEATATFKKFRDGECI